MLETASKAARKVISVNSTTQNVNRPASRTNYTGIPSQLKERLEQTTGLLLDDVRVHYNSGLPAKLDALAYTRGNQIEIAPGQEQHLPHELGHVVQQKLGIVRANAVHSSGVALNTDDRLEHQADEIGAGKKVAITETLVNETVVQRKLFIRLSRPTLGIKDSALYCSGKNNNEKSPIPVEQDSGYVMITENSLKALIDGYIQWLELNSLLDFVVENEEETVERIKEKMINKSVDASDPRNVFALDIDKESTVPRLPAGKKMEVSYYFDSLDEFYKYLFLCGEDRQQAADTWLKVNVINTKAGDAIVVTTPAGYIILDLGTNLNILLNYLSVRRDKRNSERKDDRGIPLISEKSCIVVTHGDLDHLGCKDGYTELNPELEKVIIKGYKHYYSIKYRTDPATPPSPDMIANFEKLESFLHSGKLHVFEFDPERSGKNNRDSIVISSKPGSDEVIFLCGDQEPDILIPAVEELGISRPLDNMFVKLPHHGSYKNNTPELMMRLKTSAKKVDASISSGKKYKHPTQPLCANGNSLWPQGTALIFNERNNGAIYGPTEQREIRWFSTPNLWTGEGELNPASIGHKSDGVISATYSKRYDTPSKKPQVNAEEEEIVKAMVNETISALENKKEQEEGFKKYCVSIYQNHLRSIQKGQKIVNAMMYVDNPTLFKYIFVTLDEQQQLDCLSQLRQQDELYFEVFLTTDLANKLELKPSEAWFSFLNQLNNKMLFLFSPGFISICVKKYPDNNLLDLCEYISSEGVWHSVKILIKAVIDIGERDKLIPSLLQNKEHVVQFLDYETICKLLNMKIDVESWDEVIDRVLDIIMQNEGLNRFWNYYLPRESLSDDKFAKLFSFLTRKDSMDREFLFFISYKAIQKHTNEICKKVIEGYINSSFGVLATLKGYADSPDLYTVYDAIQKGEYSIDTLEELDEVLEAYDINFVTFMKYISLTALEYDVENDMVFLAYADYFLQEEENVAYLVSLLEACCAYEKQTFMTQYLEDYIEEYGLYDLADMLLSNKLLSPKATGMFVKIIIENEWVSAVELFTCYAGLVLYITHTKAMELLASPEIKGQFYNELAQENPELALNLFIIHIKNNAEDAQKVSEYMNKASWETAARRFDLDDVLLMLQYIGKDKLDILEKVYSFDE